MPPRCAVRAKVLTAVKKIIFPPMKSARFSPAEINETGRLNNALNLIKIWSRVRILSDNYENNVQFN